MNPQQLRIYQRLMQLILKGQEAARTEGYRESEGLYFEWRLASLSFLRELFGSDNIYTEHFSKLPSYLQPEDTSDIERGLGILRGAQSEIEFGPIPGSDALMSAEIFDDLLEMAEHLLENKYFQVVPALVGAVLEEGLRKIAKKHDIVPQTSDNISALNSKLFDAKAYSLLARKKIEVWNTIRNKADHGEFDSYSPTDAQQMLESVRDFLASNLK